MLPEQVWLNLFMLLLIKGIHCEVTYTKKTKTKLLSMTNGKQVLNIDEDLDSNLLILKQTIVNQSLGLA